MAKVDYLLLIKNLFKKMKKKRSREIGRSLEWQFSGFFVHAGQGEDGNIEITSGGTPIGVSFMLETGMGRKFKKYLEKLPSQEENVPMEASSVQSFEHLDGNQLKAAFTLFVQTRYGEFLESVGVNGSSRIPWKQIETEGGILVNGSKYIFSPYPMHMKTRSDFTHADIKLCMIMFNGFYDVDEIPQNELYGYYFRGE